MTDGNVPGGGTVAQTSLTLLARVRSKDSEAWNRLVQLYGPLVGHWCRQAGLQDADANDVCQNVFKALAASIAEFQHRGGGAFRGWLRTITRNEIVSELRRKARECQGMGGSGAQAKIAEIAEPLEQESSDGQEQAEKRQILRRAVAMILSDFSEQTRAAFLRVVQDEQDPADVAKELDMSLNAVYLAKSRVMRRLREEFEGLIEQ